MPALLDLFCGAGGAAMGYHRAGFDRIVGVDLEPQPDYPFEFVQADALEYAGALTWLEWQQFGAIHASPPCQRYSTMGNRARALNGDTAPDLLPPTLGLLRGLRGGVPWVVENVAGAKRLMPNAYRLSGGMFGLRVHRPRYFLSNVLLLTPPPCAPPRDGIGVYGRAPDGRRLWHAYRAPRSLLEAQEAMGMPWGDWHGVKEAVPPAYTELIGRQLLAYVAEAA